MQRNQCLIFCGGAQSQHVYDQAKHMPNVGRLPSYRHAMQQKEPQEDVAVPVMLSPHLPPYAVTQQQATGQAIYHLAIDPVVLL